jgi:peptidoglycan/xylan/chitin deacetylase (PgdA/CDA1 family)
MTLDRLATLYLFRRLAPVPSQRRRIPILMYHQMTGNGPCRTHPHFRTATTPGVFGEHLRCLSEAQYLSLSVCEAARQIGTVEPNGRKCVVLTFDDGYEDFYTTAFPLLDRYGFTATVFLPTAYIGDTPRQFKGARCLTWSRVRELRKLGISFGSHTETHPHLEKLTVAEIERELCASRTAIEQALGEAVTSFAYPFAFPEPNRRFVQTMRQALQRADYHEGVTTIIGVADARQDRYFMRRLPMSSQDDRRFFQAKLEGAYDWAHSVQYGYKKARAPGFSLCLGRLYPGNRVAKA